MKYQLNESSQKRQKAILDALKTGVPLAGLLAVTAIVGGGCGNSESTVGIIAPPASAESSPAQVQQPNRPNENHLPPAPPGLPRPVKEDPAQPNRVNENQTPVKRGDISIVGDIVSTPGEPVAPEKHDK